MPRKTITLLLITTLGAFAGGIYRAECDSCGYSEENLWHGRGLEDPFSVYALYSVPGWRMVVSVEFDLSYEFGELIDYDFSQIRTSTAIWDVVNEHHEQYRPFFDSWTPPERLNMDNRPRGAEIASERPETRLLPEMILLERVWDADKTFACPACGSRSLHFFMHGNWD
ncbi:MAG: hypothetical protein GF399_00990 [Candidatus Coatesbacteria bacterium]|nr:hypothetical protein [Candidatus Coatesbacteria bacterium]